MMTESVQPTGAPVQLEPLSIEMEPKKGTVDELCDKFCSENMETKTKVYICLLLILPSLIYFLVSINFTSNPKKAYKQHFDKPLILNITTFAEEKFTAEEYSEAFDFAVKSDQLVVPTGFTSQSLKRYISTTSRSMNREIDDDDSTVFLLGRP